MLAAVVLCVGAVVAGAGVCGGAADMFVKHLCG